MDYEKLHKDTINKLQQMVNSGKITVEIARGICADFVPENEDEKMIKSMTRLVKAFYDCNFPTPEGFERKDMLTWLEKRGEQKPVVIIPKFKIGDNIKTANEEPLTITKIDDKGYWSEDLFICGFEDITRWELVEHKPAETVKWSPQEENCICQLESLVKEQWRQADKVHNSVNIKKMSELMFFLKTLNPNKKPQRIISAEAKEAMYDKPAWSEEDENHVKSILSTIECCKALFPNSQAVVETHNAGIEWLKSIRQRHSQWKPSEEQIKALKEAVDEHFDIDGGALWHLYQELKNLKDEK